MNKYFIIIITTVLVKLFLQLYYVLIVYVIIDHIQ